MLTRHYVVRGRRQFYDSSTSSTDKNKAWRRNVSLAASRTAGRSSIPCQFQTLPMARPHGRAPPLTGIGLTLTGLSMSMVWREEEMSLAFQDCFPCCWESDQWPLSWRLNITAGQSLGQHRPAILELSYTRKPGWASG
jgi:hypothetical protein